MIVSCPVLLLGAFSVHLVRSPVSHEEDLTLVPPPPPPTPRHWELPCSLQSPMLRIAYHMRASRYWDKEGGRIRVNISSCECGRQRNNHGGGNLQLHITHSLFGDFSSSGGGYAERRPRRTYKSPAITLDWQELHLSIHADYIRAQR